MSGELQPENNHGNAPLFMRRVKPDRPPEGVSQSILDGVVKEAKSKGDELYKDKKWQEARDAYIQGVVLHTDDVNLRKAILLNLAATNLQLGNWGEVLCDTTTVLLMDPISVKALYRSARALLELERFDEALDCCDRALKLEPHNQPLREERRAARNGAIKHQQRLLLKAYKPGMLPYFDPPTPSDPFKAPLYCNLRIRYMERFAGDMVSDFPMDKPILPLLETFLPGRTLLTSPSRVQNNLTYIPNPLCHSSVEDTVIRHPMAWDPLYEFRPSTLSVYIEARGGDTIEVDGEMALADVFAAARKISLEDGETQIEIQDGMIELLAFRTGSDAETRWLNRDYQDLVNLGDENYDVGQELGISTNLRARLFTYGPEKKLINESTSPSFAAREGIVRMAYAQ
ncbi:hypothetical protein FRC06_001593 [Ceratobasidium sp. 370]|nr:hypothetical protein FRC06_001593 [Ceratobasidium sp. 370]